MSGTCLESHCGLSGEPGILIQMLEIQLLNITTARVSLKFNANPTHLEILLIAETNSVGLRWGLGFCISNRLLDALGASGLLQVSGHI